MLSGGARQALPSVRPVRGWVRLTTRSLALSVTAVLSASSILTSASSSRRHSSACTTQRERVHAGHHHRAPQGRSPQHCSALVCAVPRRGSPGVRDRTHARTSRRCLKDMQSPGELLKPARSRGRRSHSFMARASTSHSCRHVQRPMQMVVRVRASRGGACATAVAAARGLKAASPRGPGPAPGCTLPPPRASPAQQFSGRRARLRLPSQVGVTAHHRSTANGTGGHCPHLVEEPEG